MDSPVQPVRKIKRVFKDGWRILRLILTDSVCVAVVVLAALYSLWLGGTGNEPVVDAPPTGHLKPLGAHRPPVRPGVQEITQFPYPGQFFEDYVRNGRPVVFKGLAEFVPAFQKWTDEYLSSQFGHILMTIETKKKEDRKGTLQDMALEEFLSRYSKEDLYLVGSTPYEMLSDFHLPRSLLCDGILKVLTDVIMWLSSGGTKSVLHYDELDNINCLLDGEKQFILIDKAFASHVEIGDHQGGYSNVDVDKVDMYMYPGLRDVPWYNVTLLKGDCLFIPYRWFHQVHSSEGRNLAMNIWFVHLYWLDAAKCETQELPVTESFANMDFCQAKECLRAELVGYANGSDALDASTFQTIYGQYVDSSSSLDKVFRYLDVDGDNEVGLQEFYTADADVIMDLFPKFGRKK